MASEEQGGVLHTQTHVSMLKPIPFHPMVVTTNIKTDVAAHLHAVGQSGVVVLAVVVLRLLDHHRRRSGRFVASGALKMGKICDPQLKVYVSICVGVCGCSLDFIILYHRPEGREAENEPLQKPPSTMMVGIKRKAPGVPWCRWWRKY